MPCPHHDVKIIQRSKGQSAVASAAYQSGERLFSEYDQKQKYYSHKSEIVHTEIMLPPHAPPEYADRNTLLNVFKAVKQSVTTRQAVEHYGIRVNKNGMCVCPFHNDKNPSMKLDRRFYCFGCGATGDVIDFVSRLHGTGRKEAALMLAQDFSIPYEQFHGGKGKNRTKRPVKPRLRQETEEQRFRHMEKNCFKVLSDYYHLLRRWREEYTPRQPGEEWNPLFVEALQKQSYVEYLLDGLISGDLQERAAVIMEHGKEVRQLEQRMAELAATDTAELKEPCGQRRAAPER